MKEFNHTVIIEGATTKAEINGIYSFYKMDNNFQPSYKMMNDEYYIFKQSRKGIWFINNNYDWSYKSFYYSKSDSILSNEWIVWNRTESKYQKVEPSFTLLKY